MNPTLIPTGPNVEAILGIIALIIGLVGLVIAIWHEREVKEQIQQAKTQTDSLKDITDSLKDIRESLSTRYIREFSKALPEIVSLINSAMSEIIILCDFPAYGSYTDPYTFAKYQAAIKSQIVDRKLVRITCFDADQRKEFVKLEFRKAFQNWETWKQEHEKELREYLAMPHRRAHSVDTLTVDKLTTLLEEDDQDMLRKSFAGAERHETKENMPLSFWIVDGSTGIFSIRGDPDVRMEYVFSTTDPKLITAFREMYDNLEKKVFT